MSTVTVTTVDKALGFISNNKQEKIDTANIEYAEVSFDKVDFWQADKGSSSPFSSGYVNKHVVALRQEEKGLAAALQQDPSFNAYKTTRGTGLYIKRGLVESIQLTDHNIGIIKLNCGKTTPAINFSVSSDDVHFEAAQKMSFAKVVSSTIAKVKSFSPKRTVRVMANTYSNMKCTY